MNTGIYVKLEPILITQGDTEILTFKFPKMGLTET
jgi:hypothetical protein